MRTAAFLALALAASCAGGTCGGCVDEDYRFPQDDPDRPDAVVLEDAAKLRITQDFLDFIKPQLPTLLLEQVGEIGGGIIVDEEGFIRVPVPDQDLFDIFVAEAQLREAEAAIFLADLTDRLDLVLTEAGGIELRLNDLRIALDADIRQEIATANASCPIVGDLDDPTGGDDDHAAEVSVQATIVPRIGPRPDYNIEIDVDVSDVVVGDLSIDARGATAYCAEPLCADCTEIFGVCIEPDPCLECRIFCGLVTEAVTGLASVLADLIRPAINDILSPLVSDLVDDAVAAVDGTPAKIETQLNLADVAGLDFLDRAGLLGLLAAPEPGPLAVNDRGAGLGLELSFDSGFEAPQADCVGTLEPFVATPGPVPSLSGVDGSGAPYHVGLTLSAASLNQALYAAHRAGALCLKLNTDDVRSLSGGAFTLNASLLSLLASDLSQLADPAAPAIVELKPRNPASLTLGSGAQVDVDGDGNPIFDWLLQLRLEEVGVAFHVLIEDRFVRVFEVSSDVFVGANISVLPDNTLQIALGEVRIDGFTETFNELLPNADFSEVLPTILDVALGALLNQALVFDVDLTTTISDVLGGVPIFLRVNEIFRDGAQDDYLTMSLTFAASAAQAQRRSAITTARLHPTEPGLIDRRPTNDGWVSVPTGIVRLLVGERRSSEASRGLEYQVRVDGGLWSVWRSAGADGTLVAPDARLKMPGWHDVEVRSRLADDYRTVDLTPETVRVLVDPLAPRLTARQGREGVEVTVRDEESADADGLRLDMRATSDQPWRNIALNADELGTGRATLPYADLEGVTRIELRARDGSGNPSPVVSLALTQASSGPEAEDDPAGAAGCRVSPSHRPPFTTWWILVALGIAVARRRRAAALRQTGLRSTSEP